MAARLHEKPALVAAHHLSTGTCVVELDSVANTDGGWPYYRGKSSRAEPTSWGLLAESAAGRRRAGTPQFFGTRKKINGLFVDPPAPCANVASHAMALLALFHLGGGTATATVVDAAAALVRERAIKIPYERQYYQNNRLQAWGWCPGTFSWVEPSSWAVLALKKVIAAPSTPVPLRAAAQSRIKEAERVLLNRAVITGGWNYGNANMHGRQLHAHVPTTAIALLALQDRRSEPAVRRGFEFLRAHRSAESTALALALASICLRIYGEPAGDIEALLTNAFIAARSRQNVHAMVLAGYALTGAANDYAAVRL